MYCYNLKKQKKHIRHCLKTINAKETFKNIHTVHTQSVNADICHVGCEKLTNGDCDIYDIARLRIRDTLNEEILKETLELNPYQSIRHLAQKAKCYGSSVREKKTKKTQANCETCKDGIFFPQEFYLEPIAICNSFFLHEL